MKYIDIKKLINYTITKITTEINKSYNENELSHFTKQYQCEDLRDIILLLLCQDCNTNIDVDSLEFIKEIEDELYESNFDLKLLEGKILKLESSNNELINKIEQSTQSSQINDEFNLIEQYNKILKANGLDYDTEVKKLNLQPHPQIIDGISL